MDLASFPARRWRKIRQMRRKLERCGECTPAARRANHPRLAPRSATQRLPRRSAPRGLPSFEVRLMCASPGHHSAGEPQRSRCGSWQGSRTSRVAASSRASATGGLVSSGRPSSGRGSAIVRTKLRTVRAPSTSSRVRYESISALDARRLRHASRGADAPWSTRRGAR
jgi:hypothetical protein